MYSCKLIKAYFRRQSGSIKLYGSIYTYTYRVPFLEAERLSWPIIASTLFLNRHVKAICVREAEWNSVVETPNNW